MGMATKAQAQQAVDAFGADMVVECIGGPLDEIRLDAPSGMVWSDIGSHDRIVAVGGFTATRRWAAVVTELKGATTAKCDDTDCEYCEEIL
jgi:hypothetical protein